MDFLKGEFLADAPSDTEQRTAMDAYCVQCESGYEADVVQLVQDMFDGILAHSAVQEVHQSREGVKSLVQRNLLSGYVFLYSRETPPFREILSLHRVFRFLSYGDFENYKLIGLDLEFAQWVRRHKGVLAASKAIRRGSEVTIVQGPLCDAVGTVEKIDRRNRNVCLSIPFDGNVRRVWMPFEWTSEAEDFRVDLTS